MCSNVQGFVAPASCEPCRINDTSTVATVYCADCDEFQCRECSKAHTIYTVMKNHELMKASQSKRHLVGLKLCDQHKNELTFFCEDDDMLCCGMCAFMEHRNCQKVSKIETYARSSSHNADILMEYMLNTQSTVKAYKTILEKKRNDIHNQVERIPKRIAACQEKIDESFDDMVQNVVKEANDVMEEKVMTSTERQRKCKVIYQELEALLIYIDQIVATGTSELKFITQYRLVEIYEGYLEKVKNEASSIDSLDFELEFEKIFLDSSEKDLGKLCIQITNESVIHEEELQGLAIENVVSRDLKESKSDTRVPYYFGMDFLIDGRLIVADNKNKKLVLFSQKLDVIGGYNLPEPPSCVSSLKEKEVAVTYLGGFNIELYFVSSMNKMFLCRTIKTISNFGRIYQKNDTSFIASCKNDQRFIKSLSLIGEESELDIEFPPKPVSVDAFSCTYITNLNKLVLTLQDQSNVYIFNLENKEKITVNDSRIKNPKSVAIGPLDTICVVCVDGELVQISPSGRILTSQRAGGAVPLSVCVSKDKTLVAVYSIVTENSGKLELYKFKL